MSGRERKDVAPTSLGEFETRRQPNGWGALVPGKPAVDYAVVKPLSGSPEWQPVSVTLAELVATDPAVTTARPP